MSVNDKDKIDPLRTYVLDQDSLTEAKSLEELAELATSTEESEAPGPVSKQQERPEK